MSILEEVRNVFPSREEISAEARIAPLRQRGCLLDGNDILYPEHMGPVGLSKAIDRAQHAPKAVPGKVAVIGFSLGGVAALNTAANLPDAASMAVADYPCTRTGVSDMASFEKLFHVPVLVMAGGLDHRDNDCCVVESMRVMEAEANASGAHFELAVYSEADHAFNLAKDMRGKPAHAYRSRDASDAWRHTLEKLKQYQPLP